MLKSKLEALLAQHLTPESRAFTRILRTHYKHLPAERNISFSQMICFLDSHDPQERNLLENFNKRNIIEIPLDITHTAREDQNLFRAFVVGKRAEEKKEEKSDLPELINNTYSKKRWRDALNSIGCDQETIAIFFNLVINNAIQNPQMLYQNLQRYPFKKSLKAWELCCLSGESFALDYARQKESLSPLSKMSHEGVNALHLVAFSGSVSAVRYLVDTLEFPLGNKDSQNNSVLCYAAWSGSVAVVEVIKQKSTDAKLKLDPYKKNKEGHDAFWYARQSLHPDLITAALHGRMRVPLEVKSSVSTPAESKLIDWKKSCAFKAALGSMLLGNTSIGLGISMVIGSLAVSGPVGWTLLGTGALLFLGCIFTLWALRHRHAQENKLFNTRQKITIEMAERPAAPSSLSSLRICTPL